MFEIIYTLEGETSLAFRFTIKKPANLIEVLRSFGFTRDRARAIVKDVEMGKRVPLMLPSFDMLNVRKI